MPKVSIRKKDPTDSLPSHFFHVSANPQERPDDVCKIDLCASFVPSPIPQTSRHRQEEFYVACTSARFEAIARSAEILDYLKGTEIKANYEIGGTERTRYGFTPSTNVSNGSGKTSVKVSLGEASKERESTRRTSFSGPTATLTVTKVNASRIMWSLRLHRGEQISHDFLEGELNVYLEVRWAHQEGRPRVIARGTPANKIIFNSRSKQLGRLASLGVLMKLRGYSTNTPELLTHEIHIRP